MKNRGREHTSLTETAELVVKELKKLPVITMIAPGEINVSRKASSGSRFVTIVYTPAGCELIITGQSVQKVAVHTKGDPKEITNHLATAKTLRDFTIKERERLPGI